MDLFARAGAAERLLDRRAIFGMNHREPGAVLQVLEGIAEQHRQAGRRRIDDDMPVGLDAGVEGKVRRELADQTMEVLALTQARLLDQQSFARAMQVAAQPRHD